MMYNSSKDNIDILNKLSKSCKERSVASFNGDYQRVQLINQNMLKLIQKRGRTALIPRDGVKVHEMYNISPENVLTDEWMRVQKIRYVLD